MTPKTRLSLLVWCIVVLSIAHGSAGVQAAQVQQIEHAPMQPFQARVQVTVPDNHSFATTTLPLPAGKRLVIEQVTAAGTVPSLAMTLDFSIETFLNARPVQHRLESRRFEDSVLFKVSQHLRLYSEGLVNFFASYNTSLDADHTVDFTVSGYLVDIP